VCSPIEPTQVGACTAAAVVKAAEQQGVCCNGGFLCTCVAYECVRTEDACACQLATADRAATRVGDCDDAVAANPAIKCCRGDGQCVCSAADCLPTETPVPSCGVHDLAACPADATSVPSCEPAGR
jgi:hypothetical protein